LERSEPGIPQAVVVEGTAEERGERAEERAVEVLVVDDQDTFRTALRDLVTGTPGMAVVGEASSGEEALGAADRLAPGLVIMDVRMPGMGGIEATRRLTSSHPEVVVVLVSADSRDAAPDSSGAATFLRKSQLSPRALRDAWEAHRG
jgi:DNA-binding NarL/FixJ family response regulator